MVTWAGLHPSNDWVYVLNCHFSDTIFDMFFTGHSPDKHANRKLKHFYFHFWNKKLSHPTVFELQAKTWRNVLDTDDDDADWLLGGAKAEPIQFEMQDFSKNRPRVHIGIA